MLLQFSLYDEDYRGQSTSVFINPQHVSSVKAWKERQVSTVHLTTGEKYNVIDYGKVAQLISESQTRQEST